MATHNPFSRTTPNRRIVPAPSPFERAAAPKVDAAQGSAQPTSRWIVLEDVEGLRRPIKQQPVRLLRDFYNNQNLLVLNGVTQGSEQWRKAVEDLGFQSSRTGKFLFKTFGQGGIQEKIKLNDYKKIWPGAYVDDIALSEIARKTATLGVKQLTRDTQLELQNSVLLGLNLDGDQVYKNAVGRFIFRPEKGAVYETSGKSTLRSSLFLRPSDDQTLNECADGFIQSLLGGVMQEEDLRRFTSAIADVDDSAVTKELLAKSHEIIDAAMVRHLSKNYNTASDAYGAAVRLYERMPSFKGEGRGNAAMPLPLSTLTQRLLGDTTGKTIAYPNAFDGAGFALLPVGTVIKAFSGAKEIDAAQLLAKDGVQWSQIFDPVRDSNSDALFFNADASEIEGADAGARRDYREALVNIGSLKQGGRAVLVLKGDDPMHPGVLTPASQEFFSTLHDRYQVEDVFEVARSMTHGVGTDETLRVVSVCKTGALQTRTKFDPQKRLDVMHTWDEVNARVAQTLARNNVKELASQKSNEEFVNLLQKPYTAFSKVGEAKALVPKELHQPLSAYMSSLEDEYGSVDEFVKKELGLAGDQTLAQRFSAEQVDVLSMIFHRINRGRGHILADETGIGKGRVLAGLSAWALRQGRPVVFVTDKAHLFSSFATDMRDIDEWGRVVPFVMNSGALIKDNIRNDGVLAESVKASDMKRILQNNIPLSQTGCNVVFATYSQISGDDSAKAQWIKEQLPDALLILDEAHLAAGANSNISTQISEMTALAWGVEYSSATWAKSPENMHIFARALPESVNVATLAQTMKTGGPAFMEMFSAMLARDGAFRRLEHDMSKVPMELMVDVNNIDRNRQVADTTAGVMSAIAMVAGNVKRMATRASNVNLAALREASQVRGKAKTARIFKSKFGAGDMLYKIQTQLNTALNVDNVAALAIDALNRGQKPVIVFEDTAEADIMRGLQLAQTDAQGRVVIETPTIRDLLKRIVKTLTHVRVAEVTEIDAPQDVSEDGVLRQIEQMIAQGDAAMEEDSAAEGVNMADSTATSVVAAERSSVESTAQTLPSAGVVDQGGDEIIVLDDAAVTPGEARQDLDPSKVKAKLRYTDVPLEELDELQPQEREAFKRGIEEIYRLIDAMEPVPLNALDQLTQKLQAAQLDSGITVRVGEISGRKMQLRSIDATTSQVLTRIKSKDAVQSTVRGFNGGDIDVVLINRSAATGISMHTSERVSDQRQRCMLFMQVPRNPTDLIQLLGRVNRTGQVNTPQVIMCSTGVVGELRNLMMQQQKIARLNSTARADRQSNVEITQMPDLLTPLGREVCRQFLEDHPDIVFRLDMPPEIIVKGSGVEVEQWLTSRMGMLRSDEAQQIYDQLCLMYEDAVYEAELQGENPLRPNELDVRAKVDEPQVLFGFDNQGLGSTFDGPVLSQRIVWSEKVEPMTTQEIARRVRESRAAMVKLGSVKIKGSSDAQRISQVGVVDAEQAGRIPVGVTHLAGGADAYFDVDMTELANATARQLEVRARLAIAGTEFKTSREAELSLTPNPVRKGLALASYIKENLAKLIPGRIISQPIGEGNDAQRWLRKNSVILSVQPPPMAQLSQLSRWRVTMISPGDAKPSTVSLRTLIGRVGSSIEGDNNQHEIVTMSKLEIGRDFLKTHEMPAEKRRDASQWWIYRDFESSFRGQRRREATVLSGNAYLAAEWAAKTKAGKQVIYTDDQGARHRGVLLNQEFKPEWLQYLPERLWMPKMIDGFLTRISNNEVSAEGGFHTLYGTFEAAWKSTEGSQARSAKDQILISPERGVMMFVGKEQRAKVNQMLRNAQKSIKKETYGDIKIRAEDDPGHVVIAETAKRTKARSNDTATTRRGTIVADDVVQRTSRKDADFVVLAATTPAQVKRAFEMIRRGVGLELWVAAPAPHNNPELHALAKRCVREYFAKQALDSCSNAELRGRLQDVVSQANDFVQAEDVPPMSTRHEARSIDRTSLMQQTMSFEEGEKPVSVDEEVVNDILNQAHVADGQSFEDAVEADVVADAEVLRG